MPSPQYSFLPLSRHADYGFGATADAFKEAADDLCASQVNAPRLNGHLATAYLYRHAIELYLKSMIVVLHRRLRIPFGSNSADGAPCIVVEGQTKPFHHVHSVAKLFAYFEKLVNQQSAALASFCRTDWTAFPSQIHDWINLIESTDPKSTFFRYPDPQSRAADHGKSSFQTSSPEEIIAEANSPAIPIKAFVVIDESDAIVETYRFHADVMPEFQAALRSLSDLLEAAHFGMRIELANGL